MNVNEFIEELKRLVATTPQIGEMKMYLSKDGEGNEFRRFFGDYGVELEHEVNETLNDSGNEVLIFWPNW